MSLDYLYEHDEFQMFQNSIAANPGSELLPMVLRDWLLERGFDESKAGESVIPPVYSMYLPVSYYGIGSGSGSLSRAPKFPTPTPATFGTCCAKATNMPERGRRTSTTSSQ